MHSEDKCLETHERIKNSVPKLLPFDSGIVLREYLIGCPFSNLFKGFFYRFFVVFYKFFEIIFLFFEVVFVF